MNREEKSVSEPEIQLICELNCRLCNGFVRNTVGMRCGIEGAMAESIPRADAPMNAAQSVNAGPPQGPHRGNPGLLGGAVGVVGNLIMLPINVLQTSAGLLGGVISYGLGIASVFLPQRLRGKDIGCVPFHPLVNPVF